MKKKTIKILPDHLDRKLYTYEEDIDDLITVEISEMKSKLTYCDVLDKKQLRQVKRFIKELQNREVINYNFVVEYYKTITYMINRDDDYNILNRSSVLITMYDYLKERGPALQYFCRSK